MKQRLTEEIALRKIANAIICHTDLIDCFGCEVCPYAEMCDTTYSKFSSYTRQEVCRAVLKGKYEDYKEKRFIKSTEEEKERYEEAMGNNNNANTEIVYKNDIRGTRLKDLRQGDCFVRAGDDSRDLYMCIEREPETKIFFDTICLNNGRMVSSRAENIVIPVKIRIEVGRIDGE